MNFLTTITCLLKKFINSNFSASNFNEIEALDQVYLPLLSQCFSKVISYISAKIRAMFFQEGSYNPHPSTIK